MASALDSLTATYTDSEGEEKRCAKQLNMDQTILGLVAVQIYESGSWKMIEM